MFPGIRENVKWGYEGWRGVGVNIVVRVVSFEAEAARAEKGLLRFIVDVRRVYVSVMWEENVSYLRRNV